MNHSIPWALVLLTTSSAAAQQPLDEFLDSARTRALDVREAEAALEQASSQVAEARARLLPSVTGVATYQRNEPEVVVRIPGMDEMGNPIVREAAVTPANQLSASATLSVPVLDLGAWASFFQAGATEDAASAQAELAQQNVSVAVVQLWHQVVAQRALVRAAERNVETTQRSRDAAAARVEVGAAAQLELARAQAELARAEQSLAEARLQARLAARNLEDLTAMRPSDAAVDLADDLAAEAPIERFAARADELPAARAARHLERASEIGRNGAWLALLPSVSANASARYSNAAGFGQQDAYAVGVSATWVLDFGRPARLETASAALDVARVRAERARQESATAIFDAWERVESLRASARAAQVQLDASRRAAEDARARFEAGAATQLDLIVAERDFFQAEVGSIQAIANLRVARAVLRVRSGMELDAGP
jgi:outer membrane protein